MDRKELCGHPAVAGYFQDIFGKKVRKIAVDAGLNCPNRDGFKGSGGCIFCNNSSFRPRYASQTSGIAEQIADGIKFYRRKSEGCVYLAYFQTFSNTYGPTQQLVSLYEEALACPGVEGLAIATRADCLEEELLDYFESRFGNGAPKGHPFLLVELGIESTEDRTLQRINRGHDYACCVKAVRELSSRGIAVGAHIILGLPGENRSDWHNHARRLSMLPLSTVKLHHLQIVRGTALADEYEKNPQCVHLFSPEEYALAVREFLTVLRSDIAVDRLVSETPPGLLLAPAWGMKPDEFLAILTRICTGRRVDEAFAEHTDIL